MAWTIVTNDWPGFPGPVSHWARNPSTSRAPGEVSLVSTSSMIWRGSAGRFNVDANSVGLFVK